MLPNFLHWSSHDHWPVYSNDGDVDDDLKVTEKIFKNILSSDTISLNKRWKVL